MNPIHPQDPLPFKCSPENECFNECCRDLNQTLTPYDLLRLKKHLNISSQELIKTYTSLHYGPESGLPILTFKPNPQTGHECPFVTEKGCSVYENRPASCRMYPLARAIARDRETGELQEFFALIEEPHCKGFCNPSGQTVKEWLRSQDVAEYNRQNDKLMELISLKNQVRPGRLEGAQSDQFYLALYDLDEFRKQMVEKSLLNGLDIPEAVLQKLKTDDLALLNFGLEWVKYMLFGIEFTAGQES